MIDFGSYLRGEIEARWYGQPGLLRVLAPFSWLYGRVTEYRKHRAIRGLSANLSTVPQASLSQFPERESAAPVIVVGNIVSGGTGKTPVVAEIVERLRRLGARPGVVARGYAAKSQVWPRVVTRFSDPQLCGDEAVELASRLECPVVVAPDRNAAVRWLVNYFGCTVVVSDDGLQHYRLARALEFAVVDAVRLHGNGRLLPVGPLREPVARLASVDCVIKTSRTPESTKLSESLPVPELSAVLRPVSATHLISNTTVALADTPFVGEHCIALSGIGNPRRFHDDLLALGCTLSPRVLPDHSTYANFAADWSKELLVVTTAKDAVKLVASLDTERLSQVWVLNRDVVLSDRHATVLDSLLLSVLQSVLPLTVNDDSEGAEARNHPHPEQLTQDTADG